MQSYGRAKRKKKKLKSKNQRTKTEEQKPKTEEQKPKFCPPMLFHLISRVRRSRTREMIFNLPSLTGTLNTKENSPGVRLTIHTPSLFLRSCFNKRRLAELFQNMKHFFSVFQIHTLLLQQQQTKSFCSGQDLGIIDVPFIYNAQLSRSVHEEHFLTQKKNSELFQESDHTLHMQFFHLHFTKTFLL